MTLQSFVAFWTDGITSEDSRLNHVLSTCQNLFSFTLERCNKIANEYFLQKLDLNEELFIKHSCICYRETGSIRNID